MTSLRAIAERLMHPGYSWCKDCGRPWACVDGHTTPYADGRGCFPLCESCWAALTPETRLPFYRQLWEVWREQDGDTPWPVIEAACLYERLPYETSSPEEAMRLLTDEPWEWESVIVTHKGYQVIPQLPLEVRQAWERSGQ